MDIRRRFLSKKSSRGDVDIDTTYSIMYTSSDGNVVTPYSTTAFGANITSNTYFNKKGIITFDGPVTSIGVEAFYNCTSLTSVTIPDSVTSIGDYAFLYCRSLTSITIPDSVTSIGYSAFSYCGGLTSITIPNSVTKIGDAAFASCAGELNVNCNIPGKNNSRYGIFNKSKFTKITIGNSVTSLGRYAFYGCTGELIINCNVPYESYGAFDNSELAKVTIGDSVTSIGVRAFYTCENVTSVTIGNGVTLIGSQAFDYCDNLTSVYCKATTPPTLESSDVFKGNVSSRKIYVPRASVSAYKSATYWSKYADYIVGYDF